MRLITVTVENFRCYAAPITFSLRDFTAIVGKNDVGKSSLMDAMAIFFDAASPDKDDACKGGDPKSMRITCEFDQLPDRLVVDADFPTSLAEEHLLSENDTLIIRKTYNGLTAKLSAVDAISYHPTEASYSDLLNLKKTELTARATQLGVNLDGVNKQANAPIRRAIWAHCPDLKKKSVAVPLEAEGSKAVWSSLQPYLPAFALFKSDRASTDQDAEAQDPLKSAIKEAIKSVAPKLQEVQDFVDAEVRKIAAATVAKLREMDPTIAEALNPVIKTKNWDGMFSTSITGDEGVPLNKRGSGVKRLVLLNFFRAKAEKDALEKKSSSVIYAVEEPETSQHPSNQRLLLTALRDLASIDGRQVIVTTHTPMLARCVPEQDLRFIQRQPDGLRSISVGSEATLADIATSLGVLPDHNVKLFVGVEGPHDISFLRAVSSIYNVAGIEVPKLEELELSGQIIFVPLGGANMAIWSSRLKALNRPELHICDRDNLPPAAAKYQEFMDKINARANCEAVATAKRELENYLHPHAIIEAYQANGINIALPDAFADFDDVPLLVAQALHAANGQGAWGDLKEGKQKEKMRAVKSTLNNHAVQRMTVDRLAVTDPHGEIRGWLTAIQRKMAAVGV